jgi:segregation and condensation protein B
MLKTKIESILFVSNKPTSAKQLTRFLMREGETVETGEVEKIIAELKEKHNGADSGLRVIQAGEEIQMVTAPESSEIIKKFLKEDMTGELTPASLETLTVIAYRGPISKPALEQIRGVNCGIIIRNLLIRGLIDFVETNGQSFFQVTVDFLKYLGLNAVAELPDYDRLHQAENLEQFLEKAEQNNKNNN